MRQVRNWAACPKCRIRFDLESQSKLKAAHDAYDVKSREEYLSLLADAEKPTLYGNTLREHYHSAIDEDGDLEVDYSAFCNECKFTYSFNHRETIEIE